MSMRRVPGLFPAIVLAVLLAGAAPAWSASYFIYEQYGGTWHDAYKTAANTEDDLMCWAATAANILAWGKWSTPLYETASAIFQHFQDHWTDNTGYMSWAWKWWFNGTPPPYTFASYPDVPGGGNFFPAVNFSDYYAYATGGNAMASIDSLLHQGKGVGLIISKSGAAYSHAVTAWGFSYSAPGVYSSIFLTDSDDGVLGLREYPLVCQNGLWYLGGSYSGWQISAIQALGLNSPLDPSEISDPSDPSDTPSTKPERPVKKVKPGKPAMGVPGVSSVPLAPTWLLFGTGLGSLFLLGRRRRPGKKAGPEP